MGMRLVVHGDDFAALGTDTALDRVERIQAACGVKLNGRLGPKDHDLKDTRVLNRILGGGHPSRRHCAGRRLGGA